MDRKLSNDIEDLEFGIKKGQWTPEEDTKLITCIKIYGPVQWDLLATLAGLNRSGKSCRFRWLNYLRPNLRRDKLTFHEQLRILQLQTIWGNRWSKIAQQLPGRTDNEIKNFWRTKVQKWAKYFHFQVNSPNFRDFLRHKLIPRLTQEIHFHENSESTSTSHIIAPTQHHIPLHKPSCPENKLDPLENSMKPNFLDCNYVTLAHHEQQLGLVESSMNPSLLNFNNYMPWTEARENKLRPIGSSMKLNFLNNNYMSWSQIAPNVIRPYDQQGYQPNSSIDTHKVNTSLSSTSSSNDGSNNNNNSMTVATCSDWEQDNNDNIWESLLNDKDIARYMPLP